MPDPFEALRAPITPVDPNPVFAGNLRARLERTLLRKKGALMSTLTLSEDRLRHGDIAYVSLWVPDVERAARFFAGVLGWQYAPGGGQERQVAGQSLRHGLWGTQERSTLFLCYMVDDVEAAVAQVRAAGGEAQQPAPRSYGAIADCVDDQGTPFSLYQPPAGSEDAPRPPINGAKHGDLSYITMGVTDTARARAFYGALLGWQFVPGRMQDGWQIENVAPMMGLWGGQAPQTVPMYRVDDVHAAVARVRAAGGTSPDPEQQPYGISADCVDDQGTRFYLGQM